MKALWYGPACQMGEKRGVFLQNTQQVVYVL